MNSHARPPSHRLTLAGLLPGLLLCAGAAQVAPATQPASDSGAIRSTRTITIKELGLSTNVDLWLPPPTAQPAPITAVFSRGSADTALPADLLTALASEGITVAAPRHLDSAPGQGAETIWRRRLTETLLTASTFSSTQPRPDSPPPPPTKAVLIGEGLGATTVLAAALDPKPAWATREPNAPAAIQVAAIVILSAEKPLPKIPGLSPNDLKRLKVPILLIERPPLTPPTPTPTLYDSLSAPDKYRLILKPNSPRQPRAEELAKVISTFLHAYTQNDQSAKDLLISGSITAPLDQVLSLESK